jgi:hypothetical protein
MDTIEGYELLICHDPLNKPQEYERVIFSDAELCMYLGAGVDARHHIVRFYDGVCKGAKVVLQQSYQDWLCKNSDRVADHQRILDEMDKTFAEFFSQVEKCSPGNQ